MPVVAIKGKRVCPDFTINKIRNFYWSECKRGVERSVYPGLIYKMTVAQKECDETRYWLDLLQASDLVSNAEYEILHREATELLKMIRSIVLTTKSKHVDRR